MTSALSRCYFVVIIKPPARPAGSFFLCFLKNFPRDFFTCLTLGYNSDLGACDFLHWIYYQ